MLIETLPIEKKDIGLAVLANFIHPFIFIAFLITTINKNPINYKPYVNIFGFYFGGGKCWGTISLLIGIISAVIFLRFDNLIQINILLLFVLPLPYILTGYLLIEYENKYSDYMKHCDEVLLELMKNSKIKIELKKHRINGQDYLFCIRKDLECMRRNRWILWKEKDGIAYLVQCCVELQNLFPDAAYTNPDTWYCSSCGAENTKSVCEYCQCKRPSSKAQKLSMKLP